MHRVDVHTHFLPATIVEVLSRRSEPPRIVDGYIQYGQGNGHVMLESMGDVDLRLREMDEQEIDVAVLGVNVPGVDWFPASDAPAIARAVNDELVALVEAHPDRLLAMATLPTQVPEQAAAELERTAALGMRGATLYSNVAGRTLDEPEFRVIFETAARLDVPLFLHPTFPLSASAMDAYALISTVGFLADTTTAALRLVLGGIFDRHPDLKLVLGHTGSLIPQLVGRIDYEGARLPNGMGSLEVPISEHLKLLYTDTVCAWPPALESALAFFGPERMMFGTDYPFWHPDRTYAALDQLDLEDGAADALRAGTAERVFGSTRASV